MDLEDLRVIGRGLILATVGLVLVVWLAAVGAVGLRVFWAIMGA